MKKLFLMLLAAVSLIACDKGKDDVTKPIELTDGTQTTQTLYADETQKLEGIKFKATAAWTATVTDVTKATDKDSWLKLSANSGGAGEVTLTISLDQNNTGKDRKAEIHITCAEMTIIIVVEQKAINKPEDPDNLKPVSNYITSDGKITGGEIFGKYIPTQLNWSVINMNDGNNTSCSETPYSYVNKNFDIKLPTTILENQLTNLTLIGTLTISPSDAKYAGGKLDYAGGQLELTNVAWENVVKDSYMVKKGEGYVEFLYFSKDAIVNGSATSNESDNESDGSSVLETFVYDNCKFRAGWNEVVMIAAQDATPNGAITYNVTVNNAPVTFKWVVSPTLYYPIDRIVKIDFNEVITPTTGSPSTEKYSYDLAYAKSDRVTNIAGLNIEYQEDKVIFTGKGDNITANLNSNRLIASHNRGISGYEGNYEYEYRVSSNSQDTPFEDVLSKMTRISSYDGKMSKEIYDITYDPQLATSSRLDGNYTKIIRSHYVDNNEDGVCDQEELIEQEIHNIEYYSNISDFSSPSMLPFCFSATNSFTFTQLFNLTYVSGSYGRTSVNLPKKMTNTVTRFGTLNNIQSIQRSTYYFEYERTLHRVNRVNISGVRESIPLDKEIANTKIYSSSSTLDITRE